MSRTSDRTPGEAPDRTPGKAPGKEESKFPRGMVIRLFAYLVAGHVFAGFLYLLFEMGAK
ncbi:DUF6126 family protein [Streptomyces sp. NPDC055078]